MQQFHGTCACTHMYQWNHTCPPSSTTNGTSGTFSPHSKWTYYLAVPTVPPPYLSFTERGANGTIPTQYNYQPSSLQANETINSQAAIELNNLTLQVQSKALHNQWSHQPFHIWCYQTIHCQQEGQWGPHYNAH